MRLLERPTNLLENAAITLLAIPTPVAALNELPPAVVGDFWKVIRAAVKVVDRAREDELLAEGSERENLDKLSNLLTRALNLYHDALERAAVPESQLKDQLGQWHPEPRLEQVLLRRYFYQVRGLMARIVEYGQAVLNAYDRHPVFVMDVNTLLDAVERFTGYLRGSNGLRPQAGGMDTLYVLRSIAGEAATWCGRNNPFSEFNMLSCASNTTANKSDDRGRNCADTQHYLAWVWSGATAAGVAELRAWQEKAWDDKKLNPKTKVPPDFDDFPGIKNDGEDREMWFYINGVVTDHWVAQLTAECLRDVFKRPIHILHNPTEGLHRDIAECVKGRILGQKTEVATDLRRQLERLAGRKGNRKIVVVAHSQGTIIASEIVRQLRDRGSDLPRRMEVFNFAFCADEFPDGCCRYVEHFANENDLVASLSVVPGNPYDVPGRIYWRCGAWGHFLGAHYLEGFRAGAYEDEKGDHHSALFGYLGGGNYGA